MAFKARSLLAALVIVLATAGGAAYVALNSAHPADGAAMSLAFNGNAGATAGGLGLINQTYAHVEDVYYRPVDLQHLLDGSRKGITAYLKAQHAKDITAPPMVTSGSGSGDAQIVRGAVQTVSARDPKLNEGDVTRAAITGMLASLDDPYTVYLSAREIQALNEELQGGDFGGIGVYIVQDRKTREVLMAPIPDNPAINAGVKTGDVVIAVNGTAAKGLTLDAVERLIRGPVGTKVVLTLRSPKAKDTHPVTIVRGRVHVPSAVSKFDRGVEYVRLSDFGTTSYEEVRKAMLEGKAKGAKGYVLDLRANGGGLLDAAVQISSLFIPDGTIVSTIDRAGQSDARGALHTTIGTAPLVVLVDKYTASASEITAGALQDYHAATILGTKTFGKGVVQSIYALPDHSALKITTARYVTPRGRDINKKGIPPDKVVLDPMINGEPDLRKFGTDSDPVYSAARAIIAEKGS